MTIRLYHRIISTEKFEQTVNILLNMIHQAQLQNPDQKRILYLDITGHRNQLGGYDTDTYELMSEFIPKHLVMWLTEAHMPLGMLENPFQMNDVPEGVVIEDEV
jgi:hypothetical protein